MEGMFLESEGKISCPQCLRVIAEIINTNNTDGSEIKYQYIIKNCPYCKDIINIKSAEFTGHGFIQPKTPVIELMENDVYVNEKEIVICCFETRIKE